MRALLTDPRSRLASKAAGWDYPASREWMLLAQVHDAIIDTSGVKNPERHHLPRPWASGRTKLGGGKRTAREALKILRPNGLNGR